MGMLRKKIIRYRNKNGLLATSFYVIRLSKSIMKDFFHRSVYAFDAKRKIDQYAEVYPEQHRIVAVKMMIWSFISIFRSYKSDHRFTRNIGNSVHAAPQVYPNGSVRTVVTKPTNFNVAILINGGIGDFVVLANYVYKFREAFQCPRMILDVIVERNKMAADAILSKELVDHCYYIEHDYIFLNEIPRKYDLCINVSRFPEVFNRNLERIQLFQPKLIDYMLAIDKQQQLYPRYFSHGADFDGQTAMLAKIQGKKRINQMDVGDYLGMTEEYEYDIPISKEDETLKKFQLSNVKFIVIVSGADPKNGGMKSNKLWPNEYYEEFLNNMKEKYPEYLLVQIGGGLGAPSFPQIDLDLQGKTTLEETMVILKNAELLIGNEGGMVHLRYAVHGGVSVVLFGSTDKDFFGYSCNINIKGDECPYPCEWFYKDWQLKCVNEKQFACMWSITPDIVMNRVQEVLK